MKPIDHRLLSTQELGTLLGVTRQTIRNWIKKGEISAYHIGQNLKIPVQEAVRILSFYGLPVPAGLIHEDASPLNDPYTADMGPVTKGAPDSPSRPGGSSLLKRTGFCRAVLDKNGWRQEVPDDGTA